MLNQQLYTKRGKYLLKYVSLCKTLIRHAIQHQFILARIRERALNETKMCHRILLEST